MTDIPPVPEMPDLSEIYEQLEAGPGLSTFADLDAAIEPIRFAWKPWLPYGLYSLLVSEQGLGKSSLLMRLFGTIPHA